MENIWKECIKKPVKVHYREVSPGENWVETLEGYKSANPDLHYIMKGIRGELYPIEKTIFEETYERVE